MSLDGKNRLATRVAGSSDSASSIGEQAAQQLRDQGADKLISASRGAE
jgi:porphobilinogen deaminase